MGLADGAGLADGSYRMDAQWYRAGTEEGPVAAPDETPADLPWDPDLAGDVGEPGAAPGGRSGGGADGDGQRPRTTTRRLWTTVLAVGCGGIVGAVARYAVALALPTATGGFPWDTFLVNATGSFVLGLLLVVLVERFPARGLARPLLGTGVIGAYTTFSTFEVDSLTLLRDGHPEVAVVYLAASVVAGLAAVWVGITAGRELTRSERHRTKEAA